MHFDVQEERIDQLADASFGRPGPGARGKHRLDQLMAFTL